ncbi:MFS transporter [uncultured Hyphomonas sp.]|uniref:MFS transporter n=1 Tax=uncultured Hyphomonas sp. TaxID=225298 RepID=UPI002AABDA56|nr:MFS transporter [uncultured Hyphomonas sp.]
MSDTQVVGAAPAVSEYETKRAEGGPFGIKGLAWAIFEGARNPYYNLIVIYIFAPYFANVMVGGGEMGLTISGLTITIAGFATALTAPFLGAIADQAGNRKRAIAVFVYTIVLCSVALWWSRPEGPVNVWMTMAILTVAYCCYGYSEVLHNAMLPAAGRPSALPYISGLGLTMGNLLSVGILLFFLLGLMLPGSGLPLVPAEPLIPLDQSQQEPQRFAGPFVAIWMAVLMIPFFLFMPEGLSKGVTWRFALSNLFLGAPSADGKRQGFNARVRVFVGYLKGLFKEHPQTMRFLIARTIYADAMSALLTLGAVFAGTFFGWSEIEIVIFGISGVLFGAIGGFVGGALDRWLGPKLALVWELSVLTIVLLLQLSITPDSLFFGTIENREIWNSPFFHTLSDVVYFAFIVPVAISVVAIITSSRYMLVHIAPSNRIGEFFGLYAIAGTVTVWMGPGVVSLLTWITGNQRIGMGGIGIMFLIGLMILWKVHAPKRGFDD